MSTGTYPEYHGMGHQTEVLPDDIGTVPELLAEQGYHTSGLSVNSYFAEPTGLDRGFEWFKKIDASNFVRATGVRPFLNYVRRLRRHSAGFSLNKKKHQPDYLLNELGKTAEIARRNGHSHLFPFSLSRCTHSLLSADPVPGRVHRRDSLEYTRSEGRCVRTHDRYTRSDSAIGDVHACGQCRYRRLRVRGRRHRIRESDAIYL